MTQTLNTTFQGKGEVSGATFTMIQKGEKSYLYEVKNGNSTYYEVFKIKTVALLEDFEKRIYSETEFKEVYPKAKDFGIWAWTYGTMEQAYDKFIELESNETILNK